MLPPRRDPPLKPILVVAACLFLASFALIPHEDAWTGQAMDWTADNLGFLEDFVQMSEHFGATWGIVFIALGCYLLDRDNRQRARRLFFGVLLCGLFVNVLKILLRRQRPAFDRRNDFERELAPEDSGDWWEWPEGYTLEALFDQGWMSYPSGHSAAAAFLAHGLSRYYPEARVLWWTLALGTMLSRFEGGRHYLGDVFAGAAVGMLFFELVERGELVERVGRWLRGLFRRRSSDSAESPKMPEAS